MKLISVNVGQPQEVVWGDETVSTAIWKRPVEGPTRVTLQNVAGDRQANLEVHGGVSRAVYAYPVEHYAFWTTQLPETSFSWGAFGENLTTEGLLETDVRIGDRFRAGSAEFVVTIPRMPCRKLQLRFDRPDMTKRFLESRRIGFLLAVAREGQVEAGDAIAYVKRPEDSMTVAEILELRLSDSPDQDVLRSAASLAALPDGWKDRFRKRLGNGDRSG